MTDTQAQIEAAAKAMWDSEPVIFSWGPQERKNIDWGEAIKRNLVGVKIFRRFAKVALTAAAAAAVEEVSYSEHDLKVIINAHIERCAQVAESMSPIHTLKQISAAIRALKDKP